MVSKWPGVCSCDILTKDVEAFCPYPKKYAWDQIYWLNINLFAKLANLLCQSFCCWFLSFLCAPGSSYFCGHQGIWPQKTKSEPQSVTALGTKEMSWNKMFRVWSWGLRYRNCQSDQRVGVLLFPLGLWPPAWAWGQMPWWPQKWDEFE